MSPKDILYIALVLVIYVFLYVLALVFVSLAAQRLHFDTKFKTDKAFNRFVFIISGLIYLAVVWLWMIAWTRLMLEEIGLI